MKLNLGVIDLPYVDSTGTSKSTPNATTGDVAEILEAEYHVMEIFRQLHGDEIAEALGQGFLGELESRMMGSQAPDGTAMRAPWRSPSSCSATSSNRRRWTPSDTLASPPRPR